MRNRNEAITGLEAREVIWLALVVVFLDAVLQILWSEALSSPIAAACKSFADAHPVWVRRLTGWSYPSGLELLKEMITLSFIAVVRFLELSAVFGYLLFVRKRSLGAIGFRVGSWKRTLGWTAAAALGLGALVGAAEGFGWLFWKVDVLKTVLAGATPPEEYRSAQFLGFTLLVKALWAPVVEETIFRGILYGGLRKLLPPAGAIILSAAVFAALHLGGTSPFSLQAVVAFGVPFVGGLLFAALYEKTGSLLAPMLLHGAGNAAIIMVEWLYL